MTTNEILALMSQNSPWSWIALSVIGLGICGVLFKVFS